MAASLASLSSEVLLRILSNLDEARDLVRVRQVDRRLHAVGGDALLWRDLFIHKFLRTTRPNRHAAFKRRKLSTSEPADGVRLADQANAASARVIRGLPMRNVGVAGSSYLQDTVEEDRRVDWYALFKVSRNWQTGNFTSRQLQTLQDVAGDPQQPLAGPSKEAAVSSRTLLDSTQSHIFTSSQSLDDAHDTPTLHVFPLHGREQATSNGEASQEKLASYRSAWMAGKRRMNLRITSLAVDRSGTLDSNVKVFVGYSTGDSLIVSFDPLTNQFHSETFLDDDADCNAAEAIVSAVLYTPLLVTCTDKFRIRIYRTTSDTINLVEERRTYSCHWPASLRLDPLNSCKEGAEAQFRLSIAYSTPVYPIGWTVGLQEILIGSGSCLSSRSANARRAHVVTRIDSPSKADRRKSSVSLAKTMEEERRNQVGRLTSLSYEDPFIVVGTKDNDVVCFKVAGSTRHASTSSAFAPLCLRHVCTFQGHTGTVHSVSLNEGRCVTGGSDGSVRIWRLGDEEEAVARAAGLLTTIDASLRRGLGRVVTIGSSLALGKRKRAEAEGESSVAALSLADILREARSAGGTAKVTSSSSSSAVVRWVTSAFDQIISVSAVKSATIRPSITSAGNSGSCRSEAALVEREEEQVQIWNFS